MIRQFIKYGISCWLAIFCMACQQENLTEAAKGSFRVTLLQDTLGITTKATPATLSQEITGLFQLTIRDAAGNAQYEGAFTEQNITVPEGTYTLTATYGEEQELALDAPYYVGTQPNMTAKVGETTPVTITCAVANALISVDWSNREKFDKVYADYGIQVKVGSSQVTLSPNSTQSAYLKAGVSYSLTFIGTLKESQAEVNIPLNSTNLPATLAAKEHCTLKLNIDDKAALQIQKAEVTKTTIQATIPLTWLPAPTVSAQGFDNLNQLTFYETAAPLAQLNLELSSPLQDMAFSINFQDETYQSLNDDYQLSTITDEQKQKLSTAGIILPTIGGQPAYVVMGDLLGKLQASNEGDVINTFTLKSVKANDRDIAEPIAYSIIVKKPQFKIAVDERNTWSREFTIEEATVQHGNENAIKSRLVYQFYDGTNWVDCQTREGTKGRTQQFAAAAEAISNKSYKVRALYRGVISSNEVTVSLENPDQLPNGNMEEWQLDNYHNSRYSFNPWFEGESSGFWDTNNLFTTRHRYNIGEAIGTIANYNGMAAVSLVPGRNGFAAELRSTANGRANTRGLTWHKEEDYNKVAGELYCGTAKVTTGGNDANASGDTYERIKDSAFGSRPSALQFWYKYAPFYDTEKFSVTIELLDEQSNVIATNYQEYEGNTGSTWQEINLPIAYTANEKCAFIHVLFCSTTVTGANMKYEECTYTLYKSLTDTYSFDPAYVGSVLTIDDIQLIYDK